MNYTEPVPIAAARAQHFYGLAQTPKLAGGRVPLRLALLSPAGRPIALTGDIAGFWRGWADAAGHARPLSETQLAGKPFAAIAWQLKALSE